MVLSDGEFLCDACTDQTFERAEQYDATANSAFILRPRVALLARRGDDGLILREELDASRLLDRSLALLLSLRVGDALRCCGCIHSSRVCGRVGYFIGYCVRRHLALLRIGRRTTICVSMELLRRPDDAAIVEAARMLRTMSSLASVPTLRHALSAIKSAHTMCGTPELERAETLLRQLSAPSGDDVDADEVGLSMCIASECTLRYSILRCERQTEPQEVQL